MKRPERFERTASVIRSRAALVAFGVLTAAGLCTAPAALLVSAPIAQAQNFERRIIHGKVLDDTETPAGSATVFLKNLKSHNIKSYTSLPDGDFRFAQVGMIDDYEVWAERGKTKSAVKTISSFDSRKDVQFDLKLK